MKKTIVLLAVVVALGFAVSAVFAAEEGTLKASGVVKSIGEGKLVLTAGEKELTFVVNDATKKPEGLKEGAKVVVVYKKEGEQMIALSIMVAREKKAD